MLPFPDLHVYVFMQKIEYVMKQGHFKIYLFNRKMTTIDFDIGHLDAVIKGFSFFFFFFSENVPPLYS